MKLTDLLAFLPGTLLPEPRRTTRRLCGSMRRTTGPSVESFDLSLALANPAAAPKLQQTRHRAHFQPV